MAYDDLSIENLVTVWSLFTLALLMMIIILYYTIKDIIKSAQNLFVLKDEYTVFFVTFIIIGLFFKIFVIDSYYKKELGKARSCSMFISAYVP